MTNDVYSTLGNQVRVQLLLCLADKPKNVTQLISNCGLAQSAVSQHLAKLKKAKLVATHKEGKTVWYSLPFKEIKKVAQLLKVIENKLNEIPKG